MAAVLSTFEIEAFDSCGFLRIDRLVEPAEVETLREIYDELFDRKAGWVQGDQFDLAGMDADGPAQVPQLLNPSRHAPQLLETDLHRAALALARQLLGADAFFAGDHAILKPAGSPAPTPWHQDEAYWDPALDHRALSIWVALQDVDERNGCMAFVPGSHLGEVLAHHSIGHDPRVHGLEVDDADTRNALFCPLSAGGATVHQGRTLHYTGANATQAPRRAYILVYRREAKPRDAPRDFPWQRQWATARAERARASSRDSRPAR